MVNLCLVKFKKLLLSIIGHDHNALIRTITNNYHILTVLKIFFL